jgi:hypothetical protein
MYCILITNTPILVGDIGQETKEKKTGNRGAEDKNLIEPQKGGHWDS